MTQKSVPPSTIEHAGLLGDLAETPGHVMPDHESGHPQIGKISCSYCGVGDSGVFRGAGQSPSPLPRPGEGTLTVRLKGKKLQLPARVDENGHLEVSTTVALTPPRGILTGELNLGETMRAAAFMGREVSKRFRDR